MTHSPNDEGGAEKPSATLYGHLFENKVTGLPRRVYWAIEFDLSRAASDPKSPQLAQVEWLSWDVERWSDLTGNSSSTLDAAVQPEASVYVDGEHVECRLADIQLRSREGDRILVHARLVPLGGATLQPIEVTEWAKFDGIFVQPSVIGAEAHTAELATEALGPFLAADDLAPPRWDRFRYVFAASP